MRLMVFARQDSPLSMRLQQSLSGLTGDWQIVSCPTQQELTQALNRPGQPGETILLVAAEGRVAGSLGWLDELRHKVKLVLILTDDDPGNVHDAHLLHPRFIAYADGDLGDLVQVLDHLQQRQLRLSPLAIKEAANVPAHS